MTVVLAGSWLETAKFARKQGLANIRHIVNRATLAEMSPFVASEVYVLPSFHDRPDRHGILEELNATRRQFVGVNIHEITLAELEEVAAKAPNRDFAIDASPNAVPGQISVDEAIAEVQAGQLAALQSIAPEPIVDPEPAKPARKPRKPKAAKTPVAELIADEVAAAESADRLEAFQVMADDLEPDVVEPAAPDDDEDAWLKMIGGN